MTDKAMELLRETDARLGELRRLQAQAYTIAYREWVAVQPKHNRSAEEIARFAELMENINKAKPSKGKQLSAEESVRPGLW